MYVYIYIYIKRGGRKTDFSGLRYCQEWEIDQLLQFCMHNFLFLFLLWSSRQNIRLRYAPPRRSTYKVNWRGCLKLSTCV